MNRMLATWLQDDEVYFKQEPATQAKWAFPYNQDIIRVEHDVFHFEIQNFVFRMPVNKNVEEWTYSRGCSQV